MQEPQTPKLSVNTTALAKLFEFSLEGDERTTAQLTAMVHGIGSIVKGVSEGMKPFWLTLLGHSGTGKTYLARKLWRWYIQSKYAQPSTQDGVVIYPGTWVYWPNMAGSLLGNQSYGELEDLQREKFVVLDEIGSDRDPSGHVRDCLARLLSARVGKWTIVTSNKSLGDIQRDIDTRISSRMIRDGNIVVDVDVLDYALRTITQADPAR